MDALSTSLGAFRSLSDAMQVTANNLANANTDGFKASRVHFETGPQGEGVRTQQIRQTTTPGALHPEYKVQEGDDGRLEQVQTAVETSNTDYAREAVSLIQYSASYKANLLTVQSVGETTGHILNLLV